MAKHLANNKKEAFLNNRFKKVKREKNSNLQSSAIAIRMIEIKLIIVFLTLEASFFLLLFASFGLFFLIKLSIYTMSLYVIVLLLKKYS
jgi:hypothetical protein